MTEERDDFTQGTLSQEEIDKLTAEPASNVHADQTTGEPEAADAFTKEEMDSFPAVATASEEQVEFDGGTGEPKVAESQSSTLPKRENILAKILEKWGKRMAMIAGTALLLSTVLIVFFFLGRDSSSVKTNESEAGSKRELQAGKEKTGTLDLETSPKKEIPEKSAVPQTPLPDNVEEKLDQGVKSFLAVYKESGMDQAVIRSEELYTEFDLNPGLNSLALCFGFDVSASLTDAILSSKGKAEPSDYFSDLSLDSRLIHRMRLAGLSGKTIDNLIVQWGKLVIGYLREQEPDI